MIKIFQSEFFKLRKKLRTLAAKRDISYQKLLSDMISVFKEVDKDKTIISIPSKLADKLQQNIIKSDFNTLSEYVTFLLRLLLYEDTTSKKVNNEEKIRTRLKKLGYIG